MGAIFQEILDTTIQEILVTEIQKDLNCKTDPDMIDDILCQENAKNILLFLGQEVGFSPEEANLICETEDGACKKTWTKASCIDDTKDILYPRLIESDNQARLFKKALEKYPEAENKHLLFGEDEPKSQWESDMKKLFGTLQKIFVNLGSGILCSFVGKVYN